MVFGPHNLKIAAAHPAAVSMSQAKKEKKKKKRMEEVKGQRTTSLLARLCPFILERETFQEVPLTSQRSEVSRLSHTLLQVCWETEQALCDGLCS